MSFSTSEVLAKFEGMSRDFLYYMEKAGFIKPTRLVRGKLEKRLYSEEDIEKIDLIWRYYQRGISPKQAYKKAEAQLASGTSPAVIKFREAIEHAEARGVKLAAMNLEALIGLLSNPEVDDGLREDMARLMEYVAQKYSTRD